MSVQQALIEYCIQDIVEYTVNDIGVEYDDAMKMLYESQTFEKLTDVETGLYFQSSAYNYTIFKDEMNFGHIVQCEI